MPTCFQDALYADCSSTLLRRCPRTLQHAYVDKLAAIQEKMKCWWNELPTITHCRDLDPAGPIFRPNAHLTLSYYLNLIFMGRPFLFHTSTTSDPDTSVGPSDDTPSMLAKDCIDAAVSTVDLCLLLRTNSSLANTSYTEFSSCRAAVLVIIAQTLNGQSDRLSHALKAGIELLRLMARGTESTKAELSVIEALAKAAARLTQSRATSGALPMCERDVDYDDFRSWANSINANAQSDLLGAASAPESAPSLDLFEGMSDLDLNAVLASFPLEQQNFWPSLPAIDDFGSDGFAL